MDKDGELSTSQRIYSLQDTVYPVGSQPTNNVVAKYIDVLQSLQTQTVDICGDFTQDYKIRMIRAMMCNDYETNLPDTDNYSDELLCSLRKHDIGWWFSKYLAEVMDLKHLINVYVVDSRFDEEDEEEDSDSDSYESSDESDISTDDEEEDIDSDEEVIGEYIESEDSEDDFDHI
jgi:hypothetical protein